MVGIFIYIDGKSYGIELFKDETISITSSIQNFNDLGKIFTDYSQSFTIPASATNNKIFSYWYENSLDNFFDQRVKYYGYIEVDGILFRNGRFQLEKSDKKNGMVESYTINFTGNLTQLKDRFKDDKLNGLNYDELNFNYNQSNLSNILTSGSSFPYVAFPLIGSDRRFECATGTGSDITTPSGEIDTRKLFPAIPVSKIFDYIQAKYNITFSGVFFQSLVFQKLWLYLKNAETFTVRTEPVQLDIFNATSTAIFNTTTNELFFKFGNPNVNPLTGRRWRAFLIISPSDNQIPYTLSVYDNGILYQTYENSLGQITFTIFDQIITQETPVNGDWITHRFTFFVSSNLPFTFSSRFQVRKDEDYFPNPPSAFFEANNQFPFPTQSTTSNLNIQNYVPDITVEAFVIGILKAHNLMIIPISETEFEFITMDAYFQRGKILDITQYCKKETEQIGKAKLFKVIKFLFEKSENIINNSFRGFFNREYGDLDYTNENITSTETYEVKLPFENIMYERYIPPITADDAVTNFITATLWDKDTNPYTPKPVLMYDNGFQILKVDGTTTNIRYDFSGNNFTSSNYRRFTNELELGASDNAFLYSLNFGDEFGVVNTENAPPKGLYNTYYANYVQNLYNVKTRVVTIKAVLNTFILNNLQLYDRIIYQNKRYTINTMTVDLITKETTFELLSDFRQFTDLNLGLRNSNITNLVLNNTEQEVELQIFLNDSDYWQAKTATGFLTGAYFKDKTYKDGILDVSVPANTSGVDRLGTVVIEYYKDDIGKSIQIPIFQNA
jgi:hypothetical protein